MGGGCVCDNYISKCLLNSTDKSMHLKNGNQQNTYNKITNKTSHILYNIIEANQDAKDFNKRYSDFHNYEKRYYEKNLNIKNMENKNLNNEYKNTSYNDTSFANQKNVNNTNNEDNNKNNSSNCNGSNIFQVGSKHKNNEIIEEDNNNINNNLESNNNKISYNKHNSVMQKIKENKNYLRKSEANINCNLGENNFIFINISRGSSVMNRNMQEKFESTPKMMIEKENFEEITKGKKNLFSHYCKNRMKDKSEYNCNNQIITSVFMHTLDMNKYCEEMLNTINSIRINPESFIKQIDYLMDNNIQKTEEGIFLISHEIDEKIKLMENYKEMFSRTKNILQEKINSNKYISKLEKLKYNDDLEIILDEYNDDNDDNDIDNDNENDGDDNVTESVLNNEIEYEEEVIDDIKNLPSKLNLIYGEDIIIDDDDETDINQNKNEDNNIIDFDFEENKIEEDHNSADKNIQINKIKKNNSKKVKFKPKLKKKVKKKHNINNYLDLKDDIIGNLILSKRKEIKGQYPLNIFKISVIKDIQLSILIQIAMDEFFKENNKNALKEILFSPHYKYFAVSWTNEINRNFISISCFA